RASVNFAFLHRSTAGTQNKLDEIVLIGDTIDETVANLAGFLNDKWSRAGYANNLGAETDGKKLIVKIKDRSVGNKEFFMLFFNPAIVGTNNKIYFE
ncbi:MAG: hypothetical protein HRT68_05155, partial [Flavobacteriaceae bacterium]|nr:hypothetical protein [Flavobacteriaceae bacterium]